MSNRCLLRYARTVYHMLAYVSADPFPYVETQRLCFMYFLAKMSHQNSTMPKKFTTVAIMFLRLQSMFSRNNLVSPLFQMSHQAIKTSQEIEKNINSKSSKYIQGHGICIF